MGFADSPLNPQQSNPRKLTLKQLQALSLQLLKRTQVFFEAQKLPYFASRTCKIYLGKADQVQQAKCRRILRTRLELNPAQLHRFFHTSMGSTLLAWVERFFQLPNGQAQGQSLKELLVQMAADPEGLSILSLVRRSPHVIQLNIDQILLTAKQLEGLLQVADATVATVRQLSEAELRADPIEDFATLTDIRQPGPFAVKHSILDWQNLDLQNSSQKCAPDDARSAFSVSCYQPQPLPEGRIPVVIQSHGLASCPADLAVQAEHLASYGYFVAALQHSGSDIEQVRNMLMGKTQEVFQWTEFVDRPSKISCLLNHLEHINQSDFAGRLDLQSVGVMGYSFGAYTAFALAGAEINFETLEIACDVTSQNPNISLLLQCQALELPRQTYDFRDDRVRAILAIDSVGSELFGSKGIGAIKIPVLLIAGSHDAAAPLAFEQIRIFDWLTSPHHYLAVMQGKTHVQDIQRLMSNLDLQLKFLPQITNTLPVTPFEQYSNALSLAFFNQYLPAGNEQIPCLSADYGAYISQTPYQVWLISQQSADALRAALAALSNDMMARS